jgi:hypothetical protein
MNAAETEALMTQSESGRVPDIGQRRRRGVRVTTAAAIALGLALSGGAVAGAATAPTDPPSAGSNAPSGMPDRAAPTAEGTVKSVGTDTFTLNTRSNTTVTVNVTSATTYRDRGVKAPNFATIAVGQQVAVVGTDTSDVIAATSVMIGAPPAGGPGGKGGRGGSPPVAQGTVKSVGTDTFTLTTKSSTVVTVNVTASTTYRDVGVTSPTLANVTVGETVAVFGTDSSDVVAATSVAIGTPGAGGMGSGGMGSGGMGNGGMSGGRPPSGSTSSS